MQRELDFRIQILPSNLHAFSDCGICGSNDWHIFYKGPVRNGKFGSLTSETNIARCAGCGVDRLPETDCKDEDFYVGGDYRESLGQGSDAAGFLASHDGMQQERLRILQPAIVRGKKIADIGCAAGSFLDHVRGLAGDVLAVEPGTAYHASLEARGFHTYNFTADATSKHRGTVDWATSFDVIEHTLNPREFLADIVELLAPDGRLVLSTPNRDDALLELAGDRYREFFYRVHHRWYFDIVSLAECARLAGLELMETQSIQRYGLANAITWIRDGRPSGDATIDMIDDPVLDAAWKHRLESSNRGDRIYATFKRAAA